MWHWKRQTLLGAAALTLIAGSASAQFPTTTDTEGFDTYSVGQLDGQGNWKGWDGTTTSCGLVSTTQSRSAPQSAELLAGADSVNDALTGMYDSGQWTVETWCYFPTGFIGKSYFITMNSYVDGGPYEWNGQIGFNGDTARLECDCGGATTVDRPLIYDTWVNLVLEFDFDADNVNVYFDTANEATPIASYLISGGVFGGDNFLNIRLQALDLYPDGVTFPHVTPVYYDDISIKPGSAGPPGTAVCFGDGTGAACGCGNEGVAGAGCENSMGVGAIIDGSGVASLTGDTLVLTATQTRNQPGVMFQGTNLIGGGTGITFGDGIRCAGGQVVRLGVYLPAGNTTNTDTGNLVGGLGVPNGISQHPGNSGLMAGDALTYQWWYRDPGGMNPCGADMFNLSNAYQVIWGA